MGIKRVCLLLLLLILPMLSYAQFFGLGAQYAQKSDGQFFVNLSYPTFHERNKLNLFVMSGLEYTTGGGAKISGLNLKPIQLTTFLSESFFQKTPYTILLGLDGGYLIDFRRNRKNGIVLTPNLYIDYKFFFLKAGYDFDVKNGGNQFFVRAGVGFGLGAIKSFAKTRFW